MTSISSTKSSRRKCSIAAPYPDHQSKPAVRVLFLEQQPSCVLVLYAELYWSQGRFGGEVLGGNLREGGQTRDPQVGQLTTASTWEQELQRRESEHGLFLQYYFRSFLALCRCCLQSCMPVDHGLRFRRVAVADGIGCGCAG